MANCSPPRDYSQKVWCFQCGNEYFPEVKECLECGVATTATKPPAITSLGEEQLAYDFHEWTRESRSMIEVMLTDAEVLHTWQGATLMVRTDDETEVDGVVEKVDLALQPSLTAEEALEEYDLSELEDSEVARVTKSLEEGGLPYEISQKGDLLVKASDEARVEEIFDKLQREALENSFGPGIKDADVPSMLSELHRLSARLAAETYTQTDLKEGQKALDELELLSLPFGFSAVDWRKILDGAITVNDLMISDPADSISAELRKAAISLRELLRPYG